jgi:hypothetical protein
MKATVADVDLRRAFARARAKPAHSHWPATFEDAMTSPVIAAIVRTLALHPTPPRPIDTGAARHAPRGRLPSIGLDWKALSARNDD